MSALRGDAAVGGVGGSDGEGGCSSTREEGLGSGVGSATQEQRASEEGRKRKSGIITMEEEGEEREEVLEGCGDWPRLAAGGRTGGAEYLGVPPPPDMR